MTTAYLIGVDPGLTTGLCVYSSRGQFLTGLDIHDYHALSAAFAMYPPSRVIMEDYVTVTKPDLQTIKVMGAVEYICFIYKIPLTIQSPSILSSLVKAREDYKVSKSPHINSAAYHVRYYLKVKKVKNELRKAK